MKQNKYIQKAISVFLLIIFMISMSPKTYFHTLLARHKDVSYCIERHTNTSCIHQQDIQCHFDDLVVGSSFLNDNQDKDLIALIAIKRWGAEPVSCQLHDFHAVKTVRGPPVMI